MDEIRWHRVANPGTDLYLYKKPVPASRPIFQGDVFEGVPFPVAQHPSGVAVGRRAARNAPLLDPLEYDPNALRNSMKFKVRLGMLLPHTCEFYEHQESPNPRWRTLALVREQVKEHIPEDWNGAYNLFPLPNLMGDDKPYLMQLDTIATVEESFLAKNARAAALSFEGWLALQQRIAHYFSRFLANWDQLEHDARPTWDEALDDELKARETGSSSALASKR